MESSVTNPMAEFPQEVQDAVDGLLHLGFLENPDVQFSGHTFGLRTLRLEEEMAAAKVIEPFRNTLKEPEAWMAAQVGLALTHVDNDDSFCPPAGPDRVAHARSRFQYMGRWYAPTIEFLFSEYAELLNQQSRAVAAMQGLSMRGRPTFSPLADSLSAPGTSGAPIDLDSPR
jgi:hypothetical protein